MADRGGEYTSSRFYLNVLMKNEMLNGGYGAPGWNRTNDPQLRRLMLYPTELRAHIGGATKKQFSTTDLQAIRRGKCAAFL
jgi:hypothetical protein